MAPLSETGSLKSDVRKQVTDMVSGLTESEIFYKNVLDQMVVYPDQRVEVKLNLLPQKWVFVLQKLSDLNKDTGQGVCNNNPSLLILEAVLRIFCLQRYQ